MKTWALVLPFAFIFASAPTESWHLPRWDMTVAQVKAAVPGVQPVDPKDQEMSSNPETVVRLRTSGAFLGERFAVFYEFTSQKQFGASAERLSRIHLRLVPYDGRKTAALVQRLTAKYGVPKTNFSEPGVHHIIWDTNDAQVWLSEMSKDSGVLNAPFLDVTFQKIPAE